MRSERSRLDRVKDAAEHHPSWCSAEHCYRTDHGVRVHLQASARWEDDEVRFETCLMYPEDGTSTYLELHVDDLRLSWRCVDVYLSVPAARRLRDRLNGHLDAAACGGSSSGPHSPGRITDARNHLPGE